MFRNVCQPEGYEVVGEACNGEDAITLYRSQRPDLLLLDINLPLIPGDQVLAEILKEFPEAKVVMLTMVADIDTVRRCLELGAVDYILKSNPLSDIRQMLREIVASILPAEGVS
jgi:DNA-binding NarL/FixJ family response regulator